MSSLPDAIAILDKNLKTRRQLTRLEATELQEANYDALVVEHVKLVESALQEAEIIEADSTLVAVAKQFLNIDVLLAELGDDGELRRLVIVEDKLFRNPEAQRKVLAQLLDYAYQLQNNVEASRVIESAQPTAKKVLEANPERLAQVMAGGDFLLLVCGDRLQPNLVNLMKPFLDRSRFALSRMEMGMLSLALYRDTTTQDVVLVPNVVGAIARGERDLVLTVNVKDANERPVPSEVSIEAAGRATPKRTVRWDEASFFENAVKENAGAGWADPIPGLREILAHLRSHGFTVRWGTGKIATFIAGLDVDGKDVRVLWSNSQAQVTVYRAEIAAILDEKTVNDAVGRLLKVTGGSLEGLTKAEPYIGEETFNPCDPKHAAALFAFLDEMKGLLERAKKKSG